MRWSDAGLDDEDNIDELEDDEELLDGHGQEEGQEVEGGIFSGDNTVVDSGDEASEKPALAPVVPSKRIHGSGKGVSLLLLPTEPLY